MLVTSWKESLERINAHMFSGSTESIESLTNLIQDGASMARKPIDQSVVQKSAERFLYARLIVEAWRMQGYYPVLLDTEKDCKDMGVGTNIWTTPRDLNGVARICREDGRQFHLLSVTQNAAGSCNIAGPLGMNPASNCPYRKLEVPPGLKDMRQKVTVFGGVSILDMIKW
jgi:hypothetical protein